MHIVDHYRALVISPSVYQLICSSPYLRQALLPDPTRSPYEILDYDAALLLHDRRGRRATFLRTQRIRFSQDGVSAILDHAWGDGILLTNYKNTAGRVGESFKEQGRRHLMIELKRLMGKGELLEFKVQREVREMFLSEDGWVETILDYPVERIRRVVMFPKGRAPSHAFLEARGERVRLPILHAANGRSLVSVTLPEPRPRVSYKVRWRW